jgi:hypothetical protein
MRIFIVVVFAAICSNPMAAPCQEPSELFPDFSRDPILPRNLAWRYGANVLEKSAGNYGNRIRLFGMPTGYLKDPVGLDLEDDTTFAVDSASTSVMSPEYGDDGRMGIALGVDNPFLDIRFPGDPGGFGYYKINTQYQIFDNQYTFLSMGLQAYTPAGLESEGIARGPTVFRPTLACTQELLGGTAVHGFVGRNVSARAGWTANWERGLRYGLAFQSPTLWSSEGTGRCLHMFVEALGNSRRVPFQPVLPPTWEIIPGLHWQLGDNWWLSSGVIVPLKTYRTDSGLLQITCSLRF